jgi:hypothetical protein
VRFEILISVLLHTAAFWGVMLLLGKQFRSPTPKKKLQDHRAFQMSKLLKQ